MKIHISPQFGQQQREVRPGRLLGASVLTAGLTGVVMPVRDDLARYWRRFSIVYGMPGLPPSTPHVSSTWWLWLCACLVLAHTSTPRDAERSARTVFTYPNMNN
jgi:hypothetical protein